MSKKKGKEFLKVLGITAVSIGLLSAALVGINSLAFAASTNGVENLPPVMASVVIPGEQTPPEGFQEPTLTVAVMEFENEPSVTAPSANALLLKDAAMIGAQYIWEMFGECIDGKFVAMWYVHEPSHTRAYWRGLVAESEENLSFSRDNRDNHQPLFNFAIDAVTGERIDLFNMNIVSTESEEVSAALYRMRSDNEASDAFWNSISLTVEQFPQEQLDELSQVAKAHAARHFVGTEVVSAEFFSLGMGDFDLDEEGNLFLASHRFVFEVTDSTGRVAQLSICEVTKELFWITTSHNDIVPGLDIGVRGIG